MSSIETSNTMDFTVEMLNKLADMAGQIEMLQALVRAAHGKKIDAKYGKKGKKEDKEDKPKEDKPKREISDGMKAWHAFNERIDTLLKEASLTFKRVAEGKKFASHLKKLKSYDDWAAVEIMEEREKWVEPVAETKVTEVVSESSSTEGSVKKAGRPKMTEEQKAEAKVKRDAKKAAAAAVAPAVAPAAAPARSTTPSKPKLGATPGAPKKVATTKVAWADEGKNLSAELAAEMD